MSRTPDVARLLFVVLVVAAGCAGLPAGPETATPTDGGVVDGDATPGTLNVTVVRVVDGDTVEVRDSNGTTDTVRLLGIDTPEVHVENEPVEFEGVPDTEAGRACLRDAGERSSAALRARVAGQRVRLVLDADADRRGGYGRLLAYVELGGTDLNRWLVADGHARVYDSTFGRTESYDRAESGARERRAGLWDCRNPDR